MQKFGLYVPICLMTSPKARDSPKSGALAAFQVPSPSWLYPPLAEMYRTPGHRHGSQPLAGFGVGFRSICLSPAHLVSHLPSYPSNTEPAIAHGRMGALRHATTTKDDEREERCRGESQGRSGSGDALSNNGASFRCRLAETQKRDPLARVNLPAASGTTAFIA